MDLRYGINPQQAAVAEAVAESSPVAVLNGRPSYVNMLDALNSWQLVREADRALGRPAAASFKHVSPAGAAVSGPLDDSVAELYGLRGSAVGELAGAYLRARDADPKSSYGDFVAVSRPVDRGLAELLTGLVCDGIVAPGYEDGTVATLSGKKRGSFLVLEADASFVPPRWENREVLGWGLPLVGDPVALPAQLPQRADGGVLPPSARDDLLLGLAVLRYTQSNSVCYVKDGQTLGIGAGQQSRVDCTRLAGAKVDTWWLRRHPAVRSLSFTEGTRLQDRINWQIRFIDSELTDDEQRRMGEALAEPPGTALTAEERRHWQDRLSGVSFASDGALPFRDNVDHARRHGVSYLVEPGGSIRSGEVEQACRDHGIVLARTGLRLFHH
ncbi:phosphoribosylaminoimidazolecarboxamide formyltransferase [Catellatospora vulcania]|uniref:phosphoribosylaminoimidazolecarboxamide formyltransferase n=1 Tax=Catellatospora vulcania TaxID=1460450 RepID=UPI0012D4089C|nr:phosphoribosylaminoimidazolecarboxamide formyltransferase [Catellatospora vulcania]